MITIYEPEYNKTTAARVIDEEKFIEMRSKRNGKWLHLLLNPNGGAYLEFAKRQFRIVELAISEVKDKKLRFFLTGLEIIPQFDAYDDIITDIADSDIFILREETDKPYISRLDLYAHSKKDKICLYSPEPVSDLFDYLHIYAKVEDVSNKESKENFHFIAVISNERVGEPPEVDINFSKKTDPDRICKMFYKIIKNECKTAVIVNQNYVRIGEKSNCRSEVT
ncbi:MAG: hypothetical protein FWF92_05885 [Oscillospiraceae bacterium]|nr:hypothetical protein [Oscillospiraceae bacterium]